jgi:tRNA nucleotidyltransferase/poly(A) polymerase
VELTEIFDIIKSVIPAGKEIYLVGGAVRDFVLGLQVHDLDFALPEHTKKTAQRVASKLHAPYFMLDDQRQTARVIYHPENESDLLLDFVVLAGNDIGSDLRLRDFSINSMAINIEQPGVIIDPCGGRADLKHLILRACSPDAMRSDALRILRGVRFLMSLNLTLEPETRTLMLEAAPMMKNISAERKRDELFRTLEGPTPDDAIRILDSLNGLVFLLPELTNLKCIPQSAPHTYDVWDHSLATLGYLHEICYILQNRPDVSAKDHRWKTILINHFAPYTDKINIHLSRTLVSGRSLKSLILLSALYHDIAKPQTATKDESGSIHNYGHEKSGAEITIQRAADLMLSNSEINRLSKIIAHHLRLHMLAATGKPPSRRSIYRYFRDTGDAGIDICLLSIADLLATYGSTLPTELLDTELDIAVMMFGSWWDRPEQLVHPMVWMNGDDIKKDLQLQEGPIIGKLLERLREAQASAEINNLAEAQAFVRKQYDLLSRSKS